MNRSKLDFRFLVFGYSSEKPVRKKKGQKNKTKDELKNELIRSLQEMNVVEMKSGMDKHRKKPITRKQFRWYKTTKKLLDQKRKDFERRVEVRENLEKIQGLRKIWRNDKGTCVGRLTVYFKENLLKLLEKYSKLEKSSLTLNFFKNYLKIVKEL